MSGIMRCHHVSYDGEHCRRQSHAFKLCKLHMQELGFSTTASGDRSAWVFNHFAEQQDYEPPTEYTWTKCDAQKTLQILDAMLQMDVGTELFLRDYINSAKARTLQLGLYAEMLKRGDMFWSRPFVVHINGTRKLDGSFGVTVSKFDGTLYLSPESPFWKEEEASVVLEERPALREVMQRDDADWDF